MTGYPSTGGTVTERALESAEAAHWIATIQHMLANLFASAPGCSSACFRQTSACQNPSRSDLGPQRMLSR